MITLPPKVGFIRAALAKMKAPRGQIAKAHFHCRIGLQLPASRNVVLGLAGAAIFTFGGGLNPVKATDSGIYGGGPFYKNAAKNITEIKNAGYEEAVVWNIAVNDSGDLNLNYEFLLCSGGAYVGNATHTDFVANMAALKKGTIKRLTFSIGSSNVGVFQAIQSLVNSQGTGADSMLYKNFQALKTAVPSVDALDFDDENCYDESSMVRFAVMLGNLGYKVSLCPYTNNGFWKNVATQINSQLPGTVDRIHLQCYDGGAGNNPDSSWNFGTVPVDPGLWDRDDTPSSVQTQMTVWKNQDHIIGGWMWVYDDFVGNGKAAQYASAINTAIGIDAPVISSETTASATTESPFSYQITATNLPTSYNATGLPDGLSIDVTTGFISGTPITAGNYTVTLSATNAGGTATAALALNVSMAIVAPVIGGTLSASAPINQAFTYQIVASNSPDSYTASGLPPGLSVDPDSGVVSGTPATAGTFPVSLSATNVGGTGMGTLTLTVTETTPSFDGLLRAVAQVGQSFYYLIRASDSPTAYTAAGLPSGLSISTTGTSATITGTPSTAGTFPVTVTATNAVGTGSTLLTLVVKDNAPTVMLLATTPAVVVGSGETGVFTLSLSEAQDHDVVIVLAIKGSAANGTDYVLLKTTKKIKAGRTSKPIKIVPQGNLGGMSKKTVKLVLESGTGYTVGTTGKVKVSILAGQ